MKRWFLQAAQRPTVYVGAALTLAPESFKDSVDSFKNRLRPHIEVLDFLSLDAPSAQAAFDWDLECVKKCDVFVADFSYPSTGLGVEFGIAYSLHKPIISLAAKDASVSRFIFGYVNPYHFVFRYGDTDEAVEFVLKSLSTLFPRMK